MPDIPGRQIDLWSPTTLERLTKVLDRLDEAGMKLEAKKCQLFREGILFLGHIIREG